MLDKIFSFLWDGYIDYYRWLLRFDEVWTVLIGSIVIVLAMAILIYDVNKCEDETGKDEFGLILAFPVGMFIGSFFFILNIQWDGYCSYDNADGLGITGWIGFVLLTMAFIGLTIFYLSYFRHPLWTVAKYVFIIMAMVMAIPLVIKFIFIIFIVVAFLRSILSVLLPWLFK